MKKIITSLFILSFVIVLGTGFHMAAQAEDRGMLSYSQDANVGKPFVLDGSKSQDDELVKTFTWTQVDGPQVTLSDLHAAKPTFTPAVAGTYVFELVVVDNSGVSSLAQRVSIYAKGESSDSSDQRVLPTVNKAEDDKNEVETEVKDEGDDNSDETSARVLPTVNKKTGATVTVQGWDTGKKESVQGQVDTQIESDDAVRSVEITESNVVVVYSTPAKLLGFFPIKMDLHISSNAEGKVKTRFPWYRFLVSTPFSKVEENLNAVFQNNETNFEFVKAKGSAEAQVEIFNTILKSMHEMSKSIIQNIRA